MFAGRLCSFSISFSSVIPDARLALNLRLEHALVPTWPKLAWAAHYRHGHPVVTVFHGGSVEVSAVSAVEGVWPGPFSALEFDATDLFFGSGVRLREGRVRFVSSASTVDRLWWFEEAADGFIGNTLPGVLAASGARLDSDYERYRQDLESITRGLGEYRRSFPVTRGGLEVAYWEDLDFNGDVVTRVAKPYPRRDWSDFAALRQFYLETGRAIGDNARAAARLTPITPMATISSGYDSPAAAVIAREAGATRAFTISTARAVIPRSDSGARIAGCLGLECFVVDPRKSGFHDESYFIAALGWSMDLNISLLPLDAPLTLLFTGYHGDKAWDRTHGVLNDLVVRGDSSGLGLSEYRLHAGILNCPVPFWGVREVARVREIALSAEMNPWVLGNDYDRPIPRRLVEESGVPRGLFGQRKSATTLDDEVYWPHTRVALTDFRAYLERRGKPWPAMAAIRWLNQFDKTLVSRIRKDPRFDWLRLQIAVPQSAYMVDWAVWSLIERRYKVDFLPTATE